MTVRVPTLCARRGPETENLSIEHAREALATALRNERYAAQSRQAGRITKSCHREHVRVRIECEKRLQDALDDTSARLALAEAAQTCILSSSDDGASLLMTLNGKDYALTAEQAEGLAETLNLFVVSEFVSDGPGDLSDERSSEIARDTRPEFDSPGEREQAYQDGILGNDVCEQCGEVFAGPTCVDCSDGD